MTCPRMVVVFTTTTHHSYHHHHYYAGEGKEPPYYRPVTLHSIPHILTPFWAVLTIPH